MADFLNDAEIARLLAEPKILPRNWQARLRLRFRGEVSQKRAGLTVKSASGESFRLMLRQSTINIRDFSVILGFRRPERWFRLRRHNGPHPPNGVHRNSIEAERISGFHIHIATLRYQEKGRAEDAYAVSTNRFVDLQSALECMIDDGNFRQPPPEKGDTLPLFDR